MDCHDAKERLTEGRETAAVRRHLERCEDCAAFRQELSGGGREIAEAFLAGTPSGGFEDAVARRIREDEIGVETRASGRLVRVLVPALFVLLLTAIWLLAVPREEAPSPGTDTGKEVARTAVPAPVLVPTEPRGENSLFVSVWRDDSVSPTRLSLQFAGTRRTVKIDADVEEAVLYTFALGARRAVITAGPEVPGREVFRLLETMEKIGLSYDLSRPKS
jgi:hypothetical protein